jgi:putative effector of murein hydrolase LrgA (UPF0299 family)
VLGASSSVAVMSVLLLPVVVKVEGACSKRKSKVFNKESTQNVSICVGLEHNALVSNFAQNAQHHSKQRRKYRNMSAREPQGHH